MATISSFRPEEAAPWAISCGHVGCGCVWGVREDVRVWNVCACVGVGVGMRGCGKEGVRVMKQSYISQSYNSKQIHDIISGPDN